jgi:hypothetical protein
MKVKASGLIDKLIDYIPSTIIIGTYILMIFIITDFELSMLLLVGGLLMGMVMSAMEVNLFPLRPIVIMYTLASIGAFIFILFDGALQVFSAEDLIVVSFFVLTILLMVLVAMTRPENPSTYIVKVIIDWYGVILLFVFLFSLYYFRCKALVNCGSNLPEASFQASCYFSCITFTGLGYGDIVALPKFRMVAAMQSIIGYICMGGVAATIYSLIQSKLQAIHKAKRLEEQEGSGENASS